MRLLVIILSGALITNPVFALEEGAAASSEASVGPSSEASAPMTSDASAYGAAQSSVESMQATTVGAVSPQVALALTVSTALVITTAVIYYKWKENETRRAYSYSANEAKTKLAAANANFADASPTYLKVAQLERKLMSEQRIDDTGVDDAQLARLIILRDLSLNAAKP